MKRPIIIDVRAVNNKQTLLFVTKIIGFHQFILPRS
jgi:hypothetical protein